MTEVNKQQIAFIKQCTILMDESNFKALKEASLATIERLEKDLTTDLYFSFPSDAEITKYVNLPENKKYTQSNQQVYDTGFVKGAIWMREMIDLILKNEIK